MASVIAVKRLVATPERLTVEWQDGGTSEFSSLWLRDNLREDRDLHSGQRLIDVTELPAEPRIRHAALENGAVRLEWEGESRGARFEPDWLAAHACERAARAPELEVRPWLAGGSLSARDFAWLTLAEARADPRRRLGWLTRLLQDGIAFLHEVPAQSAALLEAMPLVGRVLETNYGTTFEVRSVAQPENLAYSDLGLGLHTDNPYREPVPGFQALHALIPSRDGGDSLFADGHALAGELRATAPEAFARLTTTMVPFHYASADADLYAERPLIQLAANGTIAAVHYNNRSIAPLRLAASEAAEFYRAYRRFAAMLREPRFQLKMRLDAGTVVVFDNLRILHGRTAFSSARHPRHLRGCYLSRDSVYSETALLRRRLAAAASTAGREPAA